MSIPGLPEAASKQLLQAISALLQVQRMVLYSTRALGRQNSGSDADLCLFAPPLNLGELLEVGARQ